MRNRAPTTNRKSAGSFSARKLGDGIPRSAPFRTEDHQAISRRGRLYNIEDIRADATTDGRRIAQLLEPPDSPGTVSVQDEEHAEGVLASSPHTAKVIPSLPF